MKFCELQPRPVAKQQRAELYSAFLCWRLRNTENNVKSGKLKSRRVTNSYSATHVQTSSLLDPPHCLRFLAQKQWELRWSRTSSTFLIKDWLIGWSHQIGVVFLFVPICAYSKPAHFFVCQKSTVCLLKTNPPNKHFPIPEVQRSGNILHILKI